jgi:hypothetical protein
MFPQIPAKLPPAITKSHDVADFIMSRDMQEHDPAGPVALAWRWALTGQGPTPITLMDWDTGPPSRLDMQWQIECPDEWQGRIPWDEIRAARGVLWWLTSGQEDEVPSDLLPIEPATAAEEGQSRSL